jgi:hypothetical protein
VIKFASHALNLFNLIVLLRPDLNHSTHSMTPKRGPRTKSIVVIRYKAMKTGSIILYNVIRPLPSIISCLFDD